MFPLLLSSVVFALVSAVSVPGKVSYSGYKVFRVAYGTESSKIDSLVSSLSLETWKSSAKATGHVDVVVPPSALQDFELGTTDMETSVMHNDLGSSIAEEESFQAYAGKRFVFIGQLSD